MFSKILIKLSTTGLLLSTPLYSFAGVALQLSPHELTTGTRVITQVSSRQNAHKGASALTKRSVVDKSPAAYLPNQYRPAKKSTAKPNAIIAICQPLLVPGPSPIPSQKGGNTLKLKCIPHTLHYAGVVINKTTATALESGGKGAILVVPVKKGY